MEKRNQLYTIILLALGLVTRFAFLWYPAEAVFDETYFGKFVSGYLSGNYFFDIHPPFSKLLITLAGYIDGFRADSLSFAKIGTIFANNSYLALRFLPALAGALLPIVIYYLAKELKFSNVAAFFAGLLVVFESSLITESRYILTDSLLLIFGFSGLFLYFVARRKDSFKLFILAIIFGGFALATKWTGVSFLAIITVLEIFSGNFIWRRLLTLFGVAFVVYFLAFAVHFALLTKPGPGDAFMTQNFQKENILQKFTELNIAMFKANQQKLTHEYGSKWYSWPLDLRPVYYWNKVEGNGTEARMYLLGNPVLYWLVLFAAFSLIIHCLMRSKLYRENREVIFFLLGGYLLNLLPFSLINRVMFLYHYQTALVFGILILAFLIDKEFIPYKREIVIGITTVVIASFLFFLPLTYGIPLHESSFHYLQWFPTWR